jgi:hypothetical protein
LLLFHTNYPKNVQSTHHGLSAERKPDLVLVTLGVVAKGNASSHVWADYAFGKAGEAPKDNFKWDGCLSTVEIKWTEKPLRTKQLPGRYDAVEPVTLNHSLPKAEDDNGSQSIGHSQSVHSLAFGQYSQSPVVGQSQSVQSPSIGKSLQSIYSQSRSTSQSGVSHTSSVSSRKCRKEQGDGSPIKRTRLTEKESDAINQSAVYAAE